MSKDYYLVLGVNRGADLNKIKKAYRTIVKRHHPDVSDEAESMRRFLEVKEAYDTLSDQEKKYKYDRKLKTHTAPYRVNRVPEEMRGRVSEFRKRESDFYTKTDDFFEGFISGLYDEDKGGLQEKDLYFEAILTPSEAENGGIYPVTVPVMASCSVCSSSGLWEGLFCPLCNGLGRIPAERKFALSIPPNVSSGTEISLSLEGIRLNGIYLHIRVTIADYQSMFI